MTHNGGSGFWEMAGGARMRAVQRPDGAWSVRLPEDQPGAWPALVEAATGEGCGTLLTSRPAHQSDDHVRGLQRAGFTPTRTETAWRIPLDPRLAKPVRTQHRLLSVTEFDAEAVAALDNAIRADIPGTQGWAATGTQLLESLDDPDFDPDLYRIALHPETGNLDGLIRGWNRCPEPRLGCIGVARPWRRTSLALALVQDIARTLLSRGVTHITAETDNTNTSSHLMAINHGGVAVQTSVEWRRASLSATSSC